MTFTISTGGPSQPYSPKVANAAGAVQPGYDTQYIFGAEAPGGAPLALDSTMNAIKTALTNAPNTHDNPVFSQLVTGEEHVGLVGGYSRTPKVQIIRASDATAYAQGDMIGATPSGLVTINAARIAGGTGMLSDAKVLLSASAAITSLPAFLLWVFRPDANIPFATGLFPADNAVLNISSAAMDSAIGVFSFNANSWINQTGALGTGGMNFVQWGTLLVRQFALFDLTTLGSSGLPILLQAQNAWAPGANSVTFSISLGVQAD